MSFWSLRADALAARLERRNRQPWPGRGSRWCGGCCPLPPHVVFDEWLDPVGMTEWMCPRPARAVKIMGAAG